MNPIPVSDSEAEKYRAGYRAAAFAEDGMLVGLGSGSTSKYAVQALGERVRGGLRIQGVPTSELTQRWAEAAGIPLVPLSDVARLDLAIDGADEIDSDLNLIKGGGGAHLREKVVAALADRFIVVADSKKLVSRLGVFPLPIEIAPFASSVVVRSVEKLGGLPALRLKDGAPYVTDNGLWILDCSFGRIEDPRALARSLDALPGVAEHGLFCDMAALVIIGRRYGVELIPRR